MRIQCCPIKELFVFRLWTLLLLVLLVRIYWFLKTAQCFCRTDLLCWNLRALSVKPELCSKEISSSCRNPLNWAPVLALLPWPWQGFGKDFSKIFSFTNKNTGQSLTSGTSLQAKHFSPEKHENLVCATAKYTKSTAWKYHLSVRLGF